MRVRRVTVAGAAALAAGVLGTAPAAVQASSASGPAWTRQHPAAHPAARFSPAMAYDAATGTAVLFGGLNRSYDGDTWTWDGSTWTRQHRVVHPAARSDAAMAYDAATGTAVLFGGLDSHGTLGDTWTWDGSGWTRQQPAASPPARDGAVMAYDAATGTVVLFGGISATRGFLSDTWTWDGTTWTQRQPATSPPARYSASMGYDAATTNAVLFGGESNRGSGYLSDTWTWDGTTWTQRHPATSPPARDGAPMAYDAATSSMVLFGGSNGVVVLGDTWTWG